MASPIKKISIHGFKSIRDLAHFELGDLTVLIGANGSGKSNFVDFFRLLRAMADESLQIFAQEHGNEGLFYLGPKATPLIRASLEFGNNVYEFELSPAAQGKVFLADERIQYTAGHRWSQVPKSIGKGNLESVLKAKKDDPGSMGSDYGPPHYVYEAISSWVVYHFHDTSRFAKVRREQPLRDWDNLRPEAENIAAFLFRLKEVEKSRYELIRDTVRLMAPFFDDFTLRPEQRGDNQSIRLEWKQRGTDFPFQTSQLSDGTLRFICLATALLQSKMPTTIVIDEPELGLHPYAITLLAELIQSAATRTQVIVATQSPALLDFFPADSVVLTQRVEGCSVFERPDVGSLGEWLEDYSMGELWRKNVVQAGPAYE